MNLWLSLGVLAIALLVLLPELLLLRRRQFTSTWEALAWTAFWIVLACAFAVAVYFAYEHHWFGLGLDPGDGPETRALDGRSASLQFFTAWLVQKSLSIDNVFVFAMIFAYFRVPLDQQQRLLTWALLGTIALRGAAIAGGVIVIGLLPWTAYVFGVLLIFSALRVLAQRRGDPGADPLVRLLGRRWPPADFEDGHFFVRREGKRAATPLLPALVMIAMANVVFAIDAVPAMLSVTAEPVLVFGAMVFALLGLHSLYFLLASVMAHLHYLKLALAGVFFFVGVKMLLANHYPLPTGLSLALIATLLFAGGLASALLPPPPGGRLASPFAAELEQFVTLTLTSARRIVILVTGMTVVVVGVLMIVTPGPALLVIPAGLAILATEFLWARLLLNRFKKEARSLSQTGLRLLRRVFPRFFRKP